MSDVFHYPPPSRMCTECETFELIRPRDQVWPSRWACLACGHAPPVRDGVPFFAPELADTLTGFDPASFKALAQIEAGHYWFEPRNRLLIDLAIAFFPVADRYLEIGCGTGFVLKGFADAMPNLQITASELHPAGLVFARQRVEDGAVFVQMDARAIPARDVFDLVGAYDVLEHVEDDEAVIRSVHSALRPGGGFIAAVPQHPFLWSAVDDQAHHVRRYRRGELEEKLKRAGFTIRASTSYTAVLFPLMCVHRLARRNAPVEVSVRAEFETAPWLNRLLRTALEAEVGITRHGFRWPFGGSRIIVAQKSGADAQ